MPTDPSDALCRLQAAALQTPTAAVMSDLGHALVQSDQWSDGKAALAEALRLDPAVPDAATTLGNVLYLEGDYETALGHYRQAYSHRPTAGLAVKLALALPAILPEADQIDGLRSRIVTELDRLIALGISLDDPATEIGVSNFFLAYHGRNDKDLQRHIARFYYRVAPSLSFCAPHCRPGAAPRTPDGRIRIGFVSAFLHQHHAVGKSFQGMIERLDRSRFHVTVLQFGKETTDSRAVAAKADAAVALPNDLAKARQLIAACELDVLSYTDIGMEPLSYFLAFSRLAPVQCVHGGHPVTTGLATIDYFLSAADFEPADAQDHYSERLITFRENPSYFEPPVLQAIPDYRRLLCAEDDWVIYTCPQTLFKFHPEFDAILVAILRQDPQARILLVEGQQPCWEESLWHRLNRLAPDVADRILFTPFLSFRHFLNLLVTADAVLDPLYFGGGTTTFAAFALGVPVVTLPSPFVRGRVTCGLYQRMGITDCVASDADDYVRIALRLAHDPESRASLGARIRAANAVLFENAESIDDLGAFFAAAVTAHRHEARIESWPLPAEGGGLPDEAVWQQFDQATALRTSGDPDAAEAAFHTLVAAHPAYARGLKGLGTTLRARGKLDEAISCYEQALALRPDYAEALHNLANALRDQGRRQEAIERLRLGLDHRPELAVLHTNLAILLLDLGKHEEAFIPARQALALDPADPLALQTMGDIQLYRGDLAEALSHYDRALARSDKPGLAVKRALAQPIIADSVAAIEARRHTLLADLDRLSAAGLRLQDPLTEVGATNFYLAYQGCNDKALQERIARFYLEACPSLAWTAPHCLPGRERPVGERLRIGFVSRFLHDTHAVGLAFRGLIRGLDRQRFHCTVFQLGEVTPASQVIANTADQAVSLPLDLTATRRAIAEAALDILVFPEIGMDPATYYLAFSRLAPVQCVQGGHPDTTGIPTIDYFLSANDMEPDDAQTHYSEQLIRFPRPPVYFDRPPFTAKPNFRQDMGLADDWRVYVCPQTLFKFHPDFDAILAEILRQDPDGRLILIEGQNPHWKDRLWERLKRSHSDVADRVLFSPFLGYGNFLNLLTVADALLDPLYFGGGTTAFAAFFLGVPVITWPSPFLRGRGTYGLYQRMGVFDAVADSADSFVRLALRLAQDRPWRQALSQRLREASPALFEDDQAIMAMGDFFEAADVAARQGIRLTGFSGP